MDLIRLFTREEKIAGLEISESKLKFVLLNADENVKKEKKGKNKKIKREEEKIIIIESIESKAEVDLPKGVISNGKLVKPESLVVSLKELLNRIKIKTPYVIVSLPSQNIYIQIYDFPQRLTYEQLEESMGMTIGFSLPLPANEVFLDWELTKPIKEEKKEALLALGKKEIISPYLDALAKAGFIPIACETYPLSLSRIINAPADKPIYAAHISSEGINSMILEKESVRFSRFVPWEAHRFFIKEKKLTPHLIKEIVSEEVLRTIAFYQEESKSNFKVESVHLAGEASLIKDLVKYLSESLKIPAKEAEILPSISNNFSEKDNISFIALGAAHRGLLPRREDTFCSLMPIGTERAYEEKKAFFFVDFASHLVMITSLFFVIIFLGSFGLISFISKNMENEFQRQADMPIPKDVVELEKTAKDFNKNVALVKTLQENIPQWSKILEEIKLRKNSGITLTHFQESSLNGSMIIEGLARTRDELLIFKSNLESSGRFSDINLPIQVLEKKENINFSITFLLKDPNWLLE